MSNIKYDTKLKSLLIQEGRCYKAESYRSYYCFPLVPPQAGSYCSTGLNCHPTRVNYFPNGDFDVDLLMDLV